MSGLRYETGRDMPPGMQALTADKLVKQLREAVAMVDTDPIPETVITPPVAVVTNGDRIRATTDEGLKEKLYELYKMIAMRDGAEVARLWCDLQGGCCGTGSEELDCDEDKHKSCILRWLRSPVKEEIYGNG